MNSIESLETVVDRLSNLIAHEIESIEVSKHSSAAAFGARGANGVISITTRLRSGSNNIYQSVKLQTLALRGYPVQRSFIRPIIPMLWKMPVAQTYRATIYWNPYVRTGEDNKAMVSFYAADLPTRYRIVVEGMTSEGKVLRSERLITVREAP